ncbi:Undecaprenyl-diphosphatase [uncultured archaeon]|nr:Undecaprenyl-diphosphatase [uncultured archaeon]
MVSLIQAVILSIIQGIAEWLPISSSGHLAIMQNFFGFQNLSFDVFLHFASILAVFVVFFWDIVSLLNIRKRKNIRYILLILLGIIPAGVVGFLFRKEIEGLFSNMIYLGIFFIISGILIYLTKFSREKKETLTWFDSLFIGAFQAVAILPGISRSGATVSSGMYRGLSKQEAVRFSFLMAIPVVLGAGVLELKNIVVSDISYNLLVISFIVTFLVSLFTIKILLRIIKTDKFYLFGVYNFILGIFILIYQFIRMI